MAWAKAGRMADNWVAGVQQSTSVHGSSWEVTSAAIPRTTRLSVTVDTVSDTLFTGLGQGDTSVYIFCISPTNSFSVELGDSLTVSEGNSSPNERTGGHSATFSSVSGKEAVSSKEHL